MAEELIARYQIQSEIGRGGMATVYLAYDPNFRRNVAIKLVSSNLQTEPMYRERFEREAHLIARIEHPAIVPVYDYGENKDKLYLVMRYMPGGSLAGKIRAGEISFPEVIQIISQIAPALDAVHSQGIVHRDLKPGNILFDGFGNPAISDFGIAHFTAATSDLTGSAVIGTPAYMSPEQVRADKDVDGRSDIYALGVILFEMLARRRPFGAATPINIAFQHLTVPVPSIQTFRPDLSTEIDHILTKAMAKDREARYSTASELALDLRSLPHTSQNRSSARQVTSLADQNALTQADTTQDFRPDLHGSGVTELDVTAQDPPPSGAESLAKPQTSDSLLQDSVDRSAKPGQPARRFSRQRLQVLSIAGSGVFLLFLCGSLGLLGTWTGFLLPRVFSGESPTLPPTAPPTQTQASEGQDSVHFSDDFSDPGSGWPTGQNAQGSYSYQPDGYHILVSGLDQVLWASTGQVPDNTRTYVDATPVIEGASGYYGLLCRIQDDRNFYYLVIQGNGSFTLGKYKDGEFTSFLPEGWRQSDAVKPGNQTNRIRADCIANELRLFVNEILVGQATDTDFSSGLTGLLVAALNDQDFEVRFNHFVVVEVKE